MFKRICLFLLGIAQMGLAACNSQNVSVTAKFLNYENLSFINTPVSFSYTFTFEYGTEITYELSEEMKDKMKELTPLDIIKTNIYYNPNDIFLDVQGFYFNKSTTEPLTYGYKLYKNITVYYTIY